MRAKLSSDEGHLPSGSFRGKAGVRAVFEKRDLKASWDFLVAVEETTRRIEQFPEAGPIDRASIRRRIVPGFPFTILYEVQSDRLFIAAVVHQHRRPGYWRKRVVR